MAEERSTLTREQVRAMVSKVREELAARRAEMLLENTRPLERIHIREHTKDVELER